VCAMILWRITVRWEGKSEKEKVSNFIGGREKGGEEKITNKIYGRGRRKKNSISIIMKIWIT